MKNLAPAALTLVLTFPALGAGLDTLKVGGTTNGFRATAIYVDESDRPVGARFVHLKTRHTLDLLQIESVPQAYTWVNSFPVSDQGEPHTQEHLLLLKGVRGRTLATRQAMSLSNSSAFTQQWRTSYFFDTSAGDDVFFDLYAEQIRAMLHPNYDDEEIRREVRFFGVTRNSDGTLRLEEQGTVYQEMVSSTANPFSRLYRGGYQLVFGERHPFSYNAGGEPAGIRTMTPEDIRRFQKATHHLANMGTIAAFPPSTPFATVLARFDKVLGSADPNAKPRRADSLDDVPKPQPAAPASIRIDEYPHRNDNQPSPFALVWPANRTLDANEEFLAQLFFANLAGDATTNLYKLFIDGRTRSLDVGARAVSASVWDYGNHPVFVIFRDAAPANFTPEKLGQVRALVMEEIRRIAALPDDSAELRQFNERLANRVVEARRSLIKTTTTPPGFGFRESASSYWMDHLRRLEKTRETRKSLTLKPQIEFVRGLLGSKRNFWREYLAKWHISDTEPFVAAARPSPAMVDREEAARTARIAEEAERLKRNYATADTQEALRRFAADSAKEAERIEKEALKVAPIPFVKAPPMTLDDRLDYRVLELGNGVPLVASRFDTMPGGHVGVALRLDGAPRDELRYLSLLPQLLTQVGVIENGKPVSYEEMRERLRNEILALNARFGANVRTGRVELLMTGSGLDVPEAERALEWMRLALQSPNWRAENLPRIRDVVDQALGALRNTMQGPEEYWVQDPSNAYRRQASSHWLATQSFMTRGHNALRLRWLLKEAPSADAPALDAFFRQLAASGASLPRADLKALLAGKAPGLDTLPPAARAVALDALKDLDLALIEIPDGSLGADFTYLVGALREDLMTPPAQALAKLESVRKRVMRSGSARMYIASAGANRAALQPRVESLAAALEPAPHERADAESAPIVVARLKSRIPDAAPVHVGLFSPNKQGGVIITTVPAAHYGDFDDREKQLDFLASRLYSGGGSHGIFLKTLAAGLAYSNNLRGSLSSGQIGYYAERTPELPQTVRFVVNELRNEKPRPHLAEYAVAQAWFREGRSARTYEARAEGIADDLADGQTPEQVRKLRESMLALRKDPQLLGKLFERKDRVYARILPGYGMKAADVAGGSFFAIGPDKQLDLWESYLKSAEGPGTRLYKLYARDYWMP